jgi:hypothetical protein
VNNSHYDAFSGVSYDSHGIAVSHGNCDGSCGVAIRVDNWKLIIGETGDNRWMQFPRRNASVATPFGASGGIREAGTDHCRAPPSKEKPPTESGTFLFDLSKDLEERNNLASDPAHAALIATLTQRIYEVGKGGPPPAYVATTPAEATALEANECAATQRCGTLEPGDL